VQHQEYLQGVGEFTRRSPVFHRGVIASGDTFINSERERDALSASIPQLRCVEMEGAAVAQVCLEHGVPFVVSRIISDHAAEAAPIDIVAFMKSAAAVGSSLFARRFVEALSS
jgi:adenosylhomocysteine nucleosidase